MFVSVSDISSISYKIGQKIEDSRLMRGHTQVELASEIGLTYQRSKTAMKMGIFLFQLKYYM